MANQMLPPIRLLMQQITSSFNLLNNLILEIIINNQMDPFFRDELKCFLIHQISSSRNLYKSLGFSPTNSIPQSMENLCDENDDRLDDLDNLLESTRKSSNLDSHNDSSNPMNDRLDLLENYRSKLEIISSDIKFLSNLILSNNNFLINKNYNINKSCNNNQITNTNKICNSSKNCNETVKSNKNFNSKNKIINLNSDKLENQSSGKFSVNSESLKSIIIKINNGKRSVNFSKNVIINSSNVKIKNDGNKNVNIVKSKDTISCPKNLKVTVSNNCRKIQVVDVKHGRSEALDLGDLERTDYKTLFRVLSKSERRQLLQGFPKLNKLIKMPECL